MYGEEQHAHRRPRWLSTILVVILLVLTASGVALVVYFAPIHMVERFCRAVAAQDDGYVYHLFTTRFRQQHPLDQLSRDMQALDDVEGRVTGCHDARIANLTDPGIFTPGRLIVSTVLRRAQQGEMHGRVLLRFEDGAWRIDDLDASLLGVDLDALETTHAFCDALKGQNYGAVYTLLKTYSSGITTELEFNMQGWIWDQIGGQVYACGVVRIERGGSDSLARLTVGVTRSRVGWLGGYMTLVRVDGRWVIQSLDQQILGDDLGPLIVGRQFCQYLSDGAFHGAYLLLSHSLRAILPEYDGRWQSYTTPGLRWTCTPELATYSLKGNSASYVAAVQITHTATGKTVTLPRLRFAFVREGEVWLLDDVDAPV